MEKGKYTLGTKTRQGRKKEERKEIIDQSYL